MIERKRRKRRGDPWSVPDDWTPAMRAKHEKELILSTPLADTKLHVRIVNTLENQDIIFIRDLLDRDVAELLEIENFGEQALTKVSELVRELGIDPPWGEIKKVNLEGK